MDNIVFGVAIILAFVLPVYYFIANKNKESKAVKKSLNGFLEPLGLKVGEMEILGSKIIGLDENKSHLYYYQVAKTQIPPVIVALNDFSSCRIQAFTANAHSGSVSSGLIQKVEIVFEPKNKNGAVHHIPVFDIYK